MNSGLSRTSRAHCLTGCSRGGPEKGTFRTRPRCQFTPPIAEVSLAVYVSAETIETPRHHRRHLTALLKSKAPDCSEALGVTGVHPPGSLSSIKSSFVHSGSFRALSVGSVFGLLIWTLIVLSE